MIIRAKAPLRVSFCGGGTDIPPYSDESGGVVLSTTIDQYAYVSISPRNDKIVSITSYDLKKEVKIKNQEDLVFDGNLDLLKAAVNMFGIDRGYDLSVRCDAPPGSGLGTSSSIMVALIGALQDFAGTSLSEYEIAELAYFIERKSLGVKGGKQDQFAAAFGGFNFIEFFKDTTVVNALRINPDIFNELEYRLILCAIGRTRQMAEGTKQLKTTAYLDRLKDLTVEMKKVLLRSDLNSFGYLLDEAWQIKRETHVNTTNDEIDGLYDFAKKNGAMGGKVLGAGGGGYIVLFSHADKKEELVEGLKTQNHSVVDIRLDQEGVQHWRVK